jgi:hypothetical protein
MLILELVADGGCGGGEEREEGAEVAGIMVMTGILTTDCRLRRMSDRPNIRYLPARQFCCSH